MKLSFEGVRSNALRELKTLKTLADENDEIDTMAIECCISAYYDCLLGVMTGKVPVEEIKGFLLAYKTPEQIAAIPYCGEVVSFNKVEESAA